MISLFKFINDIQTIQVDLPAITNRKDIVKKIFKKSKLIDFILSSTIKNEELKSKSKIKIVDDKLLVICY